MKKFSALCLSLLVAFAGLTAKAQKFSYGIVAGYDLTKVKYSGDMKNNFSSDNKSGWYVGPKIVLSTVIGLGVDASLQYSQRKLNITQEGYIDGNVVYDKVSQSQTYRTIEIPINLRYSIGLGSSASVFAYTGPQFGFALQNMKFNNLGTGNNFSRENLNTTWNIGAGVRLFKHLEASVGYNFAIGKAGKAILHGVGVNEGESQDLELKYKTNTFQVQLAYMF
ncbi:outer membrane beta-barrel protein [Prevotellamassilia timonensis]|uniref:outer membrane beta-barrel protein n=1 Tax=Prevotellamassilia timonensis TaxID=1852370 RepID=UPI00307886AE